MWPWLATLVGWFGKEAVKAAIAAGGIAGAKLAFDKINDKVQKSNIKQGKKQGATSELIGGKFKGRLNEKLLRDELQSAGADMSQFDESVKQFQNYTPEQTETMNALRGLGQQGIQNLINQNDLNFEPIAQQARKDFRENTIPGIAERFTKLGSGSNRSSAFTQQLGSAASNLESNLAALRSQYGLNKFGAQAGLYNDLLGLGLKPQFENAFLGGSAQTGPGGLGNNIDYGNIFTTAYDYWKSKQNQPNQQQQQNNEFSDLTPDQQAAQQAGQQRDDAAANEQFNAASANAQPSQPQTSNPGLYENMKNIGRRAANFVLRRKPETTQVEAAISGNPAAQQALNQIGKKPEPKAAKRRVKFASKAPQK